MGDWPDHSQRHRERTQQCLTPTIATSWSKRSNRHQAWPSTSRSARHSPSTSKLCCSPRCRSRSSVTTPATDQAATRLPCSNRFVATPTASPCSARPGASLSREPCNRCWHGSKTPLYRSDHCDRACCFTRRSGCCDSSTTPEPGHIACWSRAATSRSTRRGTQSCGSTNTQPARHRQTTPPSRHSCAHWPETPSNHWMVTAVARSKTSRCRWVASSGNSQNTANRLRSGRSGSPAPPCHRCTRNGRWSCRRSCQPTPSARSECRTPTAW